MDNFFDTFRRTKAYEPVGPKGAKGDVFFVLGFDDDGRAYLNVTDKNGKSVRADYRNFNGDTFLLLRSLSAIQEADALTVSWGGFQDRIYLDSHPQLIYQILRCENVVNSEMTPLGEMDGLYQLRADIDEKGRTCTPDFRLERVDGDGPYDIKDFRFITDNYALCDNRIVAVKPIGEEFLKLSALSQPFNKSVAEQYLSLLMSHFDNVNLYVNGNPCVCSDTGVKASPAIVFEKVTEDNALFLRMAESIPGVSVDFVEDFSPTRLVTGMPDGTMTIRNVEYPDMNNYAAHLHKLVCSCAPDKKSAKDVYEENGLFIIPEETAGPFLVRYLSTLAKEFVLISSDKLAGYKIRTVTPRFNLSVSSGIDFLEGFAEIQIDDQVFTLSDFLDQYRKNRYVELSNGDKGIIDEGYVRQIERLFDKQKKGRKVKLSFFDLPEVTSLLESVPDEGIFRRSREFYTGFNALAESPDLKIKGLEAELRPYQQNGVKWLKYLYDNNFGGCLADDMGLGKTVQAISLLLLATSGRKKGRKPSMVVMPRTLLFNWKAEFAKFAHGMKIYTYYGANRDLDEASGNDVILTTYALIRNDIESFSKMKFNCLILDESQNIKNMSAKASQAVMLLEADHRFALSGTPVENRLSELYSLFRFLNPGMFSSAEEFNQRYALPIQKDADKDAMQQLRSRINPFLLRRVKEDVLTDLPEKIDQTIFVEMEEEHLRFYEKRRRFYYDNIKHSIQTEGVAKSQFEMLQALSELRRIASVPESLSDGRIHSSKIPVISQAVIEAVENGHKVVVFFNFIAGIELLGDELSKEGVGYVVMTGATSDRQSVVDRFQNDSGCKVLLMTLKTGGVGLNLTAADTVFVAEPWWNKAAEEQAIARLHRIGQKSVVHSFSVITSSSIEERILQLQQQKTSLVEALISSDSSTSKILTEDDIDFIFG
ncbi:MAG: DEAD/DEAH box helicase [Candidatus Cryptobacteroides sp.]